MVLRFSGIQLHSIVTILMTHIATIYVNEIHIKMDHYGCM